MIIFARIYHIIRMERNLRIIISGGGTGGHIFPAISIANAIKQLEPTANILFVGALGRMEMQRVPDAGYDIKGLPVCGFDRKHLWKNIKVLYKLWQSRRLAKAIIKEFKPNAAVGVGGYASGPTLNQCASLGVPYLIQEQNSYAGVTNNILQNNISKADARKAFQLDPEKKTILIIGGSLGARTINESILQHLIDIRNSDVQFIWQTGKVYKEAIAKRLEGEEPLANLHVTDFISDMASAYAAADMVISRAGASSISEFCLLGMPVILVPSPNVAEDHQTKNALALVNKQAAVYVKDAEAPEKLINTALSIVNDESKLNELHQNILGMALKNSAERIAEEVLKIAKQ